MARQRGLVDARAVEEVVDHMDLDRFADDQCVAVLGVTDVDDLCDHALEVRLALPHHRRPDRAAGYRRQTTRRELVDVAFEGRRGRVHGLGNLFGDDVHRELADVAHIVERVLATGPTGREHERRRQATDDVEERVRRHVGHTRRGDRADPADRARHDQTGRQLVAVGSGELGDRETTLARHDAESGRRTEAINRSARQAARNGSHSARGLLIDDTSTCVRDGTNGARRRSQPYRYCISSNDRSALE